MPTNEFLPFATDIGANVLTEAEYTALPARTQGFVNGIADPKAVNKALRQPANMAAALAQAIVDTSATDVLDDGDIASLKTKLIAFVNQLVALGGGGGGGSGLGFALLEAKTANFNAVAYHAYDCNTVASGFTGTLPAAPVYGDAIKFIGNFSANNLTIGRNGNSIAGVAANLTLNLDNIGPILYWVGGSIGWRVTP